MRDVPQHEVAFSVNHQLLVNLLEFELVVSVVVVAVVLDLVSILDAHVLVLVLVHRASSVVLVLGEIVIVVDPCVIAVSMVATRTVVAHVVFASETLSVAVVVSDPAVWVHHVWSAHRDRLPLQVMPYAAVPLHPSAHQTVSDILPFVANTCHCFPPVPSPDDEILNRNVHFSCSIHDVQHPQFRLQVRSQTEHPLSRLVSFVLHQTVLSQAHTRTRYPDNCGLLKFPSILVPSQEEATREPCLQPLRLLPIQLPIPMSLLQLHAANFSVLIATRDSTECMLEVVSFSALSVFLELLSVNVLQEPLQDE